MIHITDFNGDIIDFISKSDGAVTEAEHMINVEDKLETFDFTVLTSRTEHMQKRNRVIIEDKDGQYREFIIYNISSDLNGYTRVQTNASALEDIKTAKPVGPHKLNKHTVKQALEYALADTGWEVSDEAEWGGTRTTSWTGWHDRISILKQLETTYSMRLSFHVEVGSNRIEKRLVSLNKVEPMFNGEEIVYGDNMIDLKRTVDFSDIATALICLGPEDSETGKREIVEVKDDDAQAQFGLPYRYIWDIYEPQSNDENMTKKRLTTLGRTALNKRKQESISYEIDGIGLSASAGDMIRVKNEDFTPELYVDAEVVEVTTDLISGESTYKFGVIKEYTRDDVYARFNAMLSGLRERLNKVVENTDSIISERLEEELKYVERYIEKSPTPPLNPKEGQLWLDTSHDGVAVLKRYENGEWVKSSVDDVKDIGGMTREETMYEALKERAARNAVDYSEVFKRHGALVSEKHYHYVDEDIKNDLTNRYNSLQKSYDDFKIAFNNINSEQPTIGLITTAISRAVEFEARLKEYNDSYYVARKSFDEVIGVLQAQYSEEKFNEAMEEVASAIGGTFDGTNIIADIPNQEDLNELNKSIKQFLNGELGNLDEKLGKQIETVVNQAKDEFSVAIDSVEKKVDGIEVGGRNYLLDSKELKNVGGKHTNITTRINEEGHLEITSNSDAGGYASNLGIILSPNHDFKVGDTVTISVKVKSKDATGMPSLYLGLGTGYLEFSGEVKDEWTTITQTREWNLSGRFIPHVKIDNKGTYEFKEIKLEKGNKATDWSPAPEDIDNDINNLSQEVTKNSSALNVLDNKINLKVDSNTVKQMLDSELNVVKSNVQTNQSELKLLSNQISSKVEKSEYTTDMNGITRDISNTKSEINQLSDSVNSKITSVNKKIDGIEVGGRNLIAKNDIDISNGELDISKYNDKGTIVFDTKDDIYSGLRIQANKLERNTDYIIRYKYQKLSGTLESFGGHVDSTFKNGANSTYIDGERTSSYSVTDSVFVGDDEKEHVVIYKFRTTGQIEENDYFYIQPNRRNTTPVIVKISEWKLEKGTIATDWTPAPEDYQTQIDKQEKILTKHETEIEQNKLGLNTKVSYTEMNGTNKTLERLLTEFSQTKDGFNFRIDSNGMIQDLTFDRNAFKLNSKLIEFNDGDVIIKDGRTEIKDAFIHNLASNTAFINVLNSQYINSNEVTSEVGGNKTTIRGGFFESSGTYRRTWLGNTSTNQVDIRVENGYVRARNNTRNWSLYFSDFGISTYADATGADDASGSLIFRDTTYSTASSLMAHSTYGVVALQSEYNDIILAPMNTNRSGNNLFKFAVKNNDSASDTDGWIAYGSPNTNYATGIRFQKTTSGQPTVWITNGNGDIGTGDISVKDAEIRGAIRTIGGLDVRTWDGKGYNQLRAGAYNSYNSVVFASHSGSNAYFGVGGYELRITDNNGYNGGNTTYRDIRINALHTMNSYAFENHSGADTYFGVGGGTLIVTDNNHYNGGNTNYRDFIARKIFYTDSFSYRSTEEAKKDIKHWNINASKIIEHLPLFSYRYKDNTDGDLHHGVIIERGVPEFWLDTDRKTVKLNETIYTIAKALQEQIQLNKNLKKRIKKLEENK